MKSILLMYFLLYLSACVSAHSGHKGLFGQNVSSSQHVLASDESEMFIWGAPALQDLPKLNLKGVAHVVSVHDITEANKKRNHEYLKKNGVGYTAIRNSRKDSNAFRTKKITENSKKLKLKTLIHCKDEHQARYLRKKLKSIRKDQLLKE